MRVQLSRVRPWATFFLVTLVFAVMGLAAGAQSQEPKPVIPGTPVTEPPVSANGTPETGVTDSAWRGPNWGLTVDWDPAVWSVEGELIDQGYDGLQLGTPISTVFVEAYDGFGGDPDACLDEAERQIRAREGVTEVALLEGRVLPDFGQPRGPSRLFGLVAKLADGTPFRALEYVECRTVDPGTAVLELTWQTAPAAYNQEKPLVEDLLRTLTLPGKATPIAPPPAQATPLPPLPVPNEPTISLPAGTIG
jgi:hypothetical protein